MAKRNRLADPRKALGWLLDDGVRRGRRRRSSGAEYVAAAGIESETVALRRMIALRARDHEPGVVVVDDYRGAKFAVPQLLIFGDRMVGVWAYGDDVLSYRTIRLKPAHRALDVVAIVTSGHADWQIHVEPMDFPNVVDIEATWVTRSEARFHSRHSASYWSDSRRPACSADDGKTTVTDVLGFLRGRERAAIGALPADVKHARRVVRAAILGRPPTPQRMVERVIRGALRPWILERAGGAGSLIGELDVDGAIADEAVAAPDGLHVFEIKGQSDTFKRLKEQGRIYSRVATTVTLVVASRHRARALSDEVPVWWGVVVVDGGPDAPILCEERRPQLNVAGRDAKSMLRALTSVDLSEIARGYGLRRPERISKEMKVQVLGDCLDLETVAFEFGRALARRYRGQRKTECLRLGTEWPARAGDALSLFADDPDLTCRMQREARVRYLKDAGLSHLIEREFASASLPQGPIGEPPPPQLFDGLMAADSR